MGMIIAKQPNGLLCRYSTVSDSVTAYNLTPEDFIEWYAKQAKIEARLIIENQLQDFKYIKKFLRAYRSSQSEDEIKAMLKEMGDTEYDKFTINWIEDEKSY